ELLVAWRHWQKQKSPNSCVGLEAFGRCLAEVASTARTAHEVVGLDSQSALAAALKPFDRLQGPPRGASVTLHGTSPAEVAAELAGAKEFRSRLEAAVGTESAATLLREETIEALAGKLVLNAASFAVPFREGSPPLRAAGVFVLLSTMNHSCAPSVRLETSEDTGSEVSMLTTRDLEAGEPLTLAYVEPDWPGNERRHQLSSHWFFDCDCPRCEAEGRIEEALCAG
ncbi:SET5, partial [Symbiodinium pilosum]